MNTEAKKSETPDLKARVKKHRLKSKLKAIGTSALAFGAVGSAVFVPRFDAGPEALTTFHGCPMEGSAATGTDKALLNFKKNRFTFPTPENFDDQITLPRLLTASEEGWINAEGQRVPIKEGKTEEHVAATIEGYIFEVIEGGKEGSNCGATADELKDIHIYISDKEDVESLKKRDCLIVEVTPRLRALQARAGEDWSTKAVMSKLKPGTRVKMTGWLFFDTEHTHNSVTDKKLKPDFNPNAKGLWRASSWELHPVTKIEILPPKKPASSTPPKP